MRGKLTITILTALTTSLLLAWTLSSAGASADGSPPAFVQQASAHSAHHRPKLTQAPRSPRAIASSSSSASGTAAPRPPRASPTRPATPTPRFCTSRRRRTPKRACGPRRSPPAAAPSPDHSHADRQGRCRGRGLGVLGPLDRRGHAPPSIRHPTPAEPPAPRPSSPRAPPRPTSGSNELAIGMYVDSGFGDSLTAGSGFTQRANVSPTSNMELLSEDQAAAQRPAPRPTRPPAPAPTPSG